MTGAQGYNNGVLLLHTIGNKLYSSKTIGGVGRSITVEDVQLEDALYKKVDSIPTTMSEEYLNYPYIYEYDWFSQIDGKVNSKGGMASADHRVLGQSEQDSFIPSSSGNVGNRNLPSNKKYVSKS